MGQNPILPILYEFPNQSLTVREIASLANIPKTTIQRYLSELRDQKLITENNSPVNNLNFKIKKINYFTELLVSSGLIESLIKTYTPSCIILFGSISKGDSVKESDIDLFMETSITKDIDLTKYESIIGHKIQLFKENDLNKLQVHLKKNIINGIKLYGVI